MNPSIAAGNSRGAARPTALQRPNDAGNCDPGELLPRPPHTDIHYSESLAGAVPDRVIDDVVQALNELHRGAALETALRMGQLIVRHFYADDLTGWRKHKAKETSFRKLAARADRDLRVSATTLYRAVALFDLTQRLQLPSLRNMTVTHLRLVLGLPDDQQRALLTASQRHSWSAERLETETARCRVRSERKRGRPPIEPLVKVVRSILQLAERTRQDTPPPDEVGRLTKYDLRVLHGLAESAIRHLRELQGRLTACHAQTGAFPEGPPVEQTDSGPVP